MTKHFLVLLAMTFLGFGPLASAEDGHDHKKEAQPHAEAGHQDSDDHADHGDHAEEENSQAGPEKGIQAASADQGIKLSAEAEAHFAVKKKKVMGTTAEIPKDAIVRSGIEVNLYRFRDGFYKRIDFKFLRKAGSTVVVQSDDLKAGDEIALTGLGFLRTAEIAAFGGAPEGHSH